MYENKMKNFWNKASNFFRFIDILITTMFIIAIVAIALAGLYLNYGLFWMAIIILAGLGIILTAMKVISFCFEVMNGRNRQ